MTNKISDLPSVKEFDSIVEYTNYREKNPQMGMNYNMVDLFQMIRILENQNTKLKREVDRLKHLITPLG